MIQSKAEADKLKSKCQAVGNPTKSFCLTGNNETVTPDVSIFSERKPNMLSPETGDKMLNKMLNNPSAERANRMFNFSNSSSARKTDKMLNNPSIERINRMSDINQAENRSIAHSHYLAKGTLNNA